MNAIIPPSPPTNPQFGEYYGNWVWNGSRWVCTTAPGVRVIVKVFTSAAPYMPSPGLISLVVECVGGGGASGAVYTVDATRSCGGGGGGSGAYARASLAAALVMGGVNVTIGPGGVGGPSTGGNGGATSFGALCIADGGSGGEGNDLTNSFGAGGAGGVSGVGDFLQSGTQGASGDYVAGVSTAFAATIAGGYGAPGPFGGGVQALKVGPGNSAPGLGAPDGTGSGASGAVSHQVAQVVALPGADGATGVCIVTEYCWADATDDGCGCGPTGQARVAAFNQGPWQQGYDND